MPTQFRVEVLNDGANGARLRASGDVDLATATRLFETIMAVAPAPFHEVVVDLHGVTFMDSTGLSALIRAHRQLLSRDVRLVLVDPSPQVAHLVEVAHVEGYLNVEGGRDSSGRQ